MIQRLEVEADVMASYVLKKANKPWIWIARVVTTRQVIALHVGDRSRSSAKRLWAKIPAGSGTMPRVPPSSLWATQG
jgi:insertion element IS1 protein InsB